MAGLLLAATAPATAQEYTFTTLAGPGESPGALDGPGSAARFYAAYGVAVDSASNVYVADTSNHTIRKVTPGGTVTTLAGQAGSDGSADGTGSAARFSFPFGVAVDSAGNLYVADRNNHTVRKVTPGGAVTTLAGLAGSSGSTDGAGSAARFYSPYGVAVDSAGNVYVADRGNFTIRKVTPGGVVTTLAGQAGSWGSADGTGSAARFGDGSFGPSGVAVDSAGNVYVADHGNFTIRKVTAGGEVTTLAGQAGNSGSADGTGSAARFHNP
jgi:sugar lactone lactonase YvrE